MASIIWQVVIWFPGGRFFALQSVVIVSCPGSFFLWLGRLDVKDL
jgi:hypothetical protein